MLSTVVDRCFPPCRWVPAPKNASTRATQCPPRHLCPHSSPPPSPTISLPMHLTVRSCPDRSRMTHACLSSCLWDPTASLQPMGSCTQNTLPPATQCPPRHPYLHSSPLPSPTISLPMHLTVPSCPDRSSMAFFLAPGSNGVPPVSLHPSNIHTRLSIDLPNVSSPCPVGSDDWTMPYWVHLAASIGVVCPWNKDDSCSVICFANVVACSPRCVWSGCTDRCSYSRE